MTNQMNLGGSFMLPGIAMTVNRMGYGAMQLAGPHVWGPPRDMNEAVAVLQSWALDAAAASLHVSPMQIALAWLLQRSPNMLLIPGTSSLPHLRENLQASKLQRPSQMIAELDSIGRKPGTEEKVSATESLAKA
jgi:aryl-alcohol dehydrogenase-like predicted oxidoreductase